MSHPPTELRRPLRPNAKAFATARLLQFGYSTVRIALKLWRLSGKEAAFSVPNHAGAPKVGSRRC